MRDYKFYYFKLMQIADNAYFISIIVNL